MAALCMYTKPFNSNSTISPGRVLSKEDVAVSSVCLHNGVVVNNLTSKVKMYKLR